jgi:hypothetical protein
MALADVPEMPSIFGQGSSNSRSNTPHCESLMGAAALQGKVHQTSVSIGFAASVRIFCGHRRSR